MAGKKLKKVEPDKGLKIKANDKESLPPTLEHPIFCLKYLHKDYHLKECTKDEKAALIDTIYKLSQMTWHEIRQAPRHGTGREKIEKDSINSSIPEICKEENNLYALRFYGKAPFVGIQNGNIFHILYIDRNFSLYNHG